jgi:GPH family glycoside/pentoside/hexuronide:cation symporter
MQEGSGKTAMSTKLFYGFGAVAFGVKQNGFAFFLLMYYNQVLGLPEKSVGLAIMVALLFDAISDPIVGSLSDRLHSRWGRRHPFMYLSVLPIGVSYYYLWNPPAGLRPEQLFLHLVVLAIAVRIFVTFFEIPNTSLISELTEDYDDRTSMMSLRYFFGWWGGLSMSLLAYGLFLRPTAEFPVGVLNPAGYRTLGLVAACVIVSSILVSSLGTHRNIPHLKQPPPKRPFAFMPALREMRETLSNRSFLVLFGSGVFAAMGAGLSAGLNIYFVTYFWELTSVQIFFLVMTGFLSAVLALVCSPRLSARIGKKPAALTVFFSAVVFGPVPIVLRLLDVLPPNGSPLLLPLLMIFQTIEVALIISSSILTSAMVADVVEESELSTGRRSEGVFFAGLSLVGKAVAGIGVMLSTVILSVIGFPQDARPGAVDPQIITRLALVFVPVLSLLYLISAFFVTAFRISRAAHEANLRMLAGRNG